MLFSLCSPETQPVTSNQGGSAYTSSRFAPPSKSVLGQVGSFVWLIGIALVVALAGVLYIASVLMADRAEVRGANHGRILLVSSLGIFSASSLRIS